MIGRGWLSARRPLAWRWWLPACAFGVVLGQPLGDLGSRPMLLAVAAGAAAPSILYVHRALGTASVLATSTAALGALQAWHQERARAARAAQLPRGAAALGGRVVGVRPHRARAGAAGVSLDVRLTEASPGFKRGETIRLAIWKTAREWLVGDQIAVRAATRAPRGFCNGGGDGYARVTWRQGVVAVAAVSDDRAVRVGPWNSGAADLQAGLAAVRRAIARALADAVPALSQRSVLAALIYGDQSAIPAELRAAYARTGTAHVLSVSGLHIAVVAATAFGALRWLMVRCAWLALRCLVVRWAAVVAVLPATAYALLSGGAVATLRALAMGALGLGAVALVRRPDVWSALAAAALLLCLSDPGVAAEASFQLSFAAVAALVVAGRRFASWRASTGSAWLDPVRPIGRAGALVAGAVVAALAAGIATGPITAYHFGSVALLGVVANLVVVPLVGWLALLLGLTGAALLPVWRDAAAALLGLAAATIEPGNDLVEWLAGMRGAAVDVALPSAVHVVAVLVLAAACLLPAGWRRRAALALALAVLLAIGSVRRLGDWIAPRLVVRFLDVGQGDAILLSSALGEGILVDAGGLGGAYDPGARVVVPALRRSGVSELALMVLSHPDHDHHGGLAAVARTIGVDEFWSSGQRSASAGYRSLAALLDGQSVAQRAVRRGALHPLASGAELLVLHPDQAGRTRSRNDASVVIQVAFGASRLLLTGDVEAAGEIELVRGGDIASTVVKVAHHGSRTSSSRSFVARSRPALAIALLGADNRFGFPAPEVRRRYADLGAAWLQTDRTGEVVVSSDGQLEVVSSCRQS